MVIATVLLSIIGMSAGLVLGSRHEESQRAGEQTSYVPTEQAESRADCPPEMHATARKLGYKLRMTQVLKVRAASTGTTVWICADDNGKLYYQANRGGYDKTWIEGKTALFLAEVSKEGDGYRAVAHDGNTFFVNEERLEVVKKGVTETSDVVPE